MTERVGLLKMVKSNMFQPKLYAKNYTPLNNGTLYQLVCIINLKQAKALIMAVTSN